MTVAKVVPTGLEREFRIEELFFSTTDRKGVIVSGNSVFCRVAGYDEHEIIGRPHNIVRHPEMPRCVFRLLWEYLEAGRPIAAYVKNLAKDGGFYWVLATVAPTEGGYLSVRLKPSTAYFKVIQSVYPELLLFEQQQEAAGLDRKAAMDASTARLLELLSANGFEDYGAFMRAMLPAELASRDQLVRDEVGVTRDRMRRGGQDREQQRLDEIADSAGALGRYFEGIFAHLDAYASLNRQLGEASVFLLDLASDVRLFSFNAVVSAGHLAAAGAALGEVASLMCAHSEVTSKSIVELSNEITGAAALLRDLSFRTSIARVQIEMTMSFARELLRGEGDERDDRASAGLCGNVHALSACLHEDIDRLTRLPGTLQRISQLVQSVQTGIRVLSALQFSGRVECSRFGEAEGFGVLFDEIGARLSEAACQIAGLEAATSEARAHDIDATRVREHLDAIEESLARAA